MYPRGAATATVHVPEVSEPLEGEFRPGHFDGVATVVLLLLNQVQPQVAVFGDKDYQQLAVIRRMVADLQVPVEIIGHPTVREADGLAMSSRNRYLAPEQRKVAPELYATLRDLAAHLQAGERDFDTLQTQAAQRLDAAGFRTQYIAVRALNLAGPVPNARKFVVLGAAYLGSTRLIDNITVGA
jgi:pantoate--beta-alanine ligase